ncbi:MAG: oxaloacetate-decarboxylating malate dehydrogenase, partial [Acidimicrobiia bacterium]|nr:oxaloacetate-decarboxylating malate dehydrogenase [Acidimicrobiia bacterium]
YVDFVDTFVDALTSRFPGVLLQWEDFAGHHAADLLHRHRDRVLSFNDDIQGTAAVTLAAVHAAVIAADTTLADQRVCIVGAGSAGTGIAATLADAIAADGATDPGSHLYLVDADGLLHDHRHDLTAHQQRFAQRWDHVADWANPTGPTPLAAVVDHVLPTVLIGVSGQPGLFTEPIIRSMAATTPHPIVLPLSNPTDRAEALPGDLLAWTDGRALIATGSPFGPVTRNGATHTIAQANNVYIFPGLGLGALAAGAHRITDSMLRAAARAVADTSPCTAAGPSAPILPALDDLHTVSRRIANAVANAAIDDDVSQDINRDDIDSRIAQHWWTPDYQTAAPTVQTPPSPSQ